MYNCRKYSAALQSQRDAEERRQEAGENSSVLAAAEKQTNQFDHVPLGTSSSLSTPEDDGTESGVSDAPGSAVLNDENDAPFDERHMKTPTKGAAANECRSPNPYSVTPEADCPICFEAMGPSSGRFRTTCKHFFHKRCLSNWRAGHNKKCPLCRQALPRGCGLTPVGHVSPPELPPRNANLAAHFGHGEGGAGAVRSAAQRVRVAMQRRQEAMQAQQQEASTAATAVVPVGEAPGGAAPAPTATITVAATAHAGRSDSSSAAVAEVAGVAE